MQVPRLHPNHLAGAHRAVRQPRYDPASVRPGIVHLGIGNFHRAHQAVYIDDLLASDPNWGITGVSLRRPDMAGALNPQAGLYTLGLRDGERTDLRVIGSVLDVIHHDGPCAPTVTQMADPRTAIVSLTVTEKGYCHDPATGDLDTANAAIVADLADMTDPRSMPGLLVAALGKRRDAGAAPFTALSCDNLPHNGATLGRIAAQFAALVDDGLAQWIEREVAFPSTMVDRIVPATTDADRAEIERATGLHDAWPVMTEPFSQWVIEDRFCGPRPDFGSVGAELVADVAPFEAMKLRMLNGAHSAIAYLGQLAGHQTVADAVADPAIAGLVRTMWSDEIIPTLAVPGADLPAYGNALMNRFANTALKHRTLQIAMDGSQKVPQRLLDTIRDRRAVGAPCDALTKAVAAWLAFVRRNDGAVDDPMAAQFQSIVARTAGDDATFVNAMIGIGPVFGDLAGDAAFAATVQSAFSSLSASGGGL